jgi:hypothetical protein
MKNIIHVNGIVAGIIAGICFHCLWEQIGTTATLSILILFFAHNLDKHWRR